MILSTWSLGAPGGGDAIGSIAYAFFAKHWKGPVQLRGLQDRNYTVFDYVNGTSLGTLSGHNASAAG